jgi:hypothetical protein
MTFVLLPCGLVFGRTTTNQSGYQPGQIKAIAIPTDNCTYQYYLSQRQTVNSKLLGQKVSLFSYCFLKANNAEVLRDAFHHDEIGINVTAASIYVY